MIGLLALLFTIASGGVLAKLRFKQNFITGLCGAVVVLVYILLITGFFNILNVGMILCVLTSVGILVYSFISVKKQNQKISLIDNTVVAFLIICACIVYNTYGKVFDSWDEFSHWGDVVKAMTSINALATSPASKSWYPSYPPGMTLVQFYAERINMLFDKAFTEWLVYAAFQIVVALFILPVYYEVAVGKGLLKTLGALFTVFIVPLVFFEYVFRYLYVDSVLGILFGCGIAMILLHKESDKKYVYYECCVCSFLVLVKATGFFFAMVICALTVVELTVFTEKEKRIKNIKMVAGVAAACIIPKFMWEFHLKHNNVHINNQGTIDLIDFFNTITGRTPSYKNTVIKNFMYKFFIRSAESVKIPSLLVLATICLGILVLTFFLYKKKYLLLRKVWTVNIVLWVSVLFYTIGMLLTYLYKFSEYEATVTASYNRYMSTMYEGLWIALYFVWLFSVNKECPKKWIAYVLTVVATVCVVPKASIKMSVTRQIVKESYQYREPYIEIEGKVAEYCDRNIIYLISQGDNGRDLTVLQSTLRPNYVSSYGWSFGSPVSEEDIYSVDYSVDEVIDLWKDKKYEYVIVMKSNDQLSDKYADLFAQPDCIRDNSLYKINDQWKLEYCP